MVKADTWSRIAYGSSTLLVINPIRFYVYILFKLKIKLIWVDHNDIYPHKAQVDLKVHTRAQLVQKIHTQERR